MAFGLFESDQPQNLITSSYNSGQYSYRFDKKLPENVWCSQSVTQTDRQTDTRTETIKLPPCGGTENEKASLESKSTKSFHWNIKQRCIVVI